MKKLLLVMLVPVLVLGLVGCGNKLETGSETPYILHGTFVTALGAQPKIVFTANEITLIGSPDSAPIYAQRLAFRSESSVRTQVVADGTAIAFTIRRITDGSNWGVMNFTKDSDNQLTLVSWAPGDVKYYEYINLPLGVYTRAP